MPEKATLESARKAKRKGRAPSTQAGAFVREEIHHVREGKHGAASTKQAIAIGLAKARRAGVKLPPPPRATATTRNSKRKNRSAVTSKALSSQARSVARRRPASARSASARKAARTKGPSLRHQAAQRAARTRQRRRRHGAYA